MPYDIVIDGGGIIGAACAFRLSSEGLKVGLIEANEIAGVRLLPARAILW